MSLNQNNVSKKETQNQNLNVINRFNIKFGEDFATNVLNCKLTAKMASIFLNRHRQFERQYIEYCHVMLQRMKKVTKSVNPVGPEVQAVYDEWFAHSADIICDFIDEIRSYFNLDDKETGEFVFCCTWRRLQQTIDQKMEENRDKFIAEVVAGWANMEAINE